MITEGLTVCVIHGSAEICWMIWRQSYDYRGTESLCDTWLSRAWMNDMEAELWLQRDWQFVWYMAQQSLDEWYGGRVVITEGLTVCVIPGSAQLGWMIWRQSYDYRGTESLCDTWLSRAWMNDTEAELQLQRDWQGRVVITEGLTEFVWCKAQQRFAEWYGGRV